MPGRFGRTATLPAAGFTRDLRHRPRLFKIAVLTGQIGFRVAADGIAALGFNELFGALSKRRDPKRLPLGAFSNLEKSQRNERRQAVFLFSFSQELFERLAPWTKVVQRKRAARRARNHKPGSALV